MAITARPEVLKPRVKSGGASSGKNSAAFSDKNLDLLSHLLDDFIRIPGTPIRFGLDGIIGFIPGLGDIAGGLASSILILAAWKRGVPRAVLARMVLNVAIETGAGALPVVGNLFDIGWRANRRNYALLVQAAPAHPGLAQPGKPKNWLLLAGICLALAGLMLIPLLLAGWLLVHLTHALGSLRH